MCTELGGFLLGLTLAWVFFSTCELVLRYPHYCARNRVCQAVRAELDLSNDDFRGGKSSALSAKHGLLLAVGDLVARINAQCDADGGTSVVSTLALESAPRPSAPLFDLDLFASHIGARMASEDGNAAEGAGRRGGVLAGFWRVIGMPDFAAEGPALVRRHFLASYRDAGGLVAGAPTPVGQFGCTQVLSQPSSNSHASPSLPSPSRRTGLTPSHRILQSGCGPPLPRPRPDSESRLTFRGRGQEEAALAIEYLLASEESGWDQPGGPILPQPRDPLVPGAGPGLDAVMTGIVAVEEQTDAIRALLLGEAGDGKEEQGSIVKKQSSVAGGPRIRQRTLQSSGASASEV